MEKYKPSQVQIFEEINKINIEKCQLETIRRWISNVKEIIQKVEKLTLSDIRRHFEC